MTILETVWICGRWAGKTKRWLLLGAFTSEQQAVDACLDGSTFVGPIALDVRLSDEPQEWPGAYYPRAPGAAATEASLDALSERERQTDTAFRVLCRRLARAILIIGVKSLHNIEARLRPVAPDERLCPRGESRGRVWKVHPEHPWPPPPPTKGQSTPPLEAPAESRERDSGNRI